MLFTLSCLLYFGAVSSPNSYSTCSIEQLETAYHPAIVMIQSSPTQSAYIITEYGDEAECIDVYEQDCD